MNDAIRRIFRTAILSSRLNVKELRFLSQAVKSQEAAAKRRLQADVGGIGVPPFLIASISTRCNLHCAGCYARANHTCLDEPAKEELRAGRWKELFEEAASLGVSFVLLAGGEPLERPDVLEEAAGIPELIYPVFTNGTLFSETMLKRFDRHRNLVPVISMEGGRDQTDRRRGSGTFDTVLKCMEDLNRLGIFFGVSITVTKENLNTVTDPAFIAKLKKAGCRLILFVEYVPADGNAEPALEEEERRILGTRRGELEALFPPMIFLVFPGDEAKMGGCLAAGRGFFHLNAFGDAEPCPFSPYSDTNLKTGTLRDALTSDLFYKIRESNLQSASSVGGCALFSRKAEIEELL